ncbi:prepilin-type N-terminal cleavage/methylation domain-containing protein [Candidatus Riflebacteria bacterium]
MQKLKQQKSNHIHKQFSLVELMVAVAIVGLLTTLAVKEFMGQVHRARISKCKADLDKLSQALRLYNAREEETYKFSSFIPLIGTYLLEEPPKDPWQAEYILDSVRGMVYSKGPDGEDDKGDPLSDDMIRYFSPSEILLKKVVYQDSNVNNIIDFGDTLILNFTRAVHTEDLESSDFILSESGMSLGSAIVHQIPIREPSNVIKIEFAKPQSPVLRIGSVRLDITDEGRKKIRDLSRPPKRARKGIPRKILRFK